MFDQKPDVGAHSLSNRRSRHGAVVRPAPWSIMWVEHDLRIKDARSGGLEVASTTWHKRGHFVGESEWSKVQPKPRHLA